MDEQSQNLTNLKHWMAELDAREIAQVQHAMDYAGRHASAGAPGHGQFLLIAKMAHQLEQREHAIVATVRMPVVQKVVWSDVDHCWRDVITGVKVQVP